MYPNYDSSGYDLDNLKLDQLADLREWQLERLEKVTRELRKRVQSEYAQGVNIKALAKKAGVTRRTVYAWLEQ
jgi:DNA invertase Pin-like site-specific DNA recombinase